MGGVGNVGEKRVRVRAQFLRLSVILFCAELAHGMLLYAIIPDLVRHKFPDALEVAAFCVGGYTLAELLCKVPAGHRVDRFGPDLPLLLGLGVSLATVPLILFTGEPLWMITGSFLHGAGAAPVWPAVISSWTRGRSPRERGEIMGQILTGWMAGLGMGFVSGQFLLDLSGRAELVVNFAPILMWIVTLGALAWTGQRLGYPALPEEGDLVEPVASEGFPPELKTMAIGLFLQNLAFGALILPFNFVMLDHFHLTRMEFASMLVLGGGPAVLLMGPMGKLSDRVGRRRAVIGAMWVVAPMIAAAPFLSFLKITHWSLILLLVPGLIVAGAAYAFLLPAWHALALGRIPENQRGRSLALLMSVEMAAMTLGHVLGTPLYHRIGFWVPFVIAGTIFAVLAIIYHLGYILPTELHEEKHGH
ncbi:MAG: MFS transporter [Armatimonadetes bacterium]|nr:MFS transporter [Armatimonadota bacterium]